MLEYNPAVEYFVTYGENSELHGVYFFLMR
jgi:hypothetical protein